MREPRTRQIPVDGAWEKAGHIAGTYLSVRMPPSVLYMQDARVSLLLWFNCYSFRMSSE